MYAHPRSNLAYSLLANSTTLKIICDLRAYAPPLSPAPLQLNCSNNVITVANDLQQIKRLHAHRVGSYVWRWNRWNRDNALTLMRKRYKRRAGVEFGPWTYPGLLVHRHEAKIAQNFLDQRRLFLRLSTYDQTMEMTGRLNEFRIKSLGDFSNFFK